MADDIATEIAEIEDSMADDFAGYEADPALRERYAGLLQAQEAGTDAPARPDADTVRRGELETMMGDRHSPYWSGSKAESLQQEYRGLLGAERAPADQAEGAAAAADQAVQFTDADVDAGLAALATGGDVARQWAVDLGTGASARNALRVGEDQRVKLLASMGDSAHDVETAFDASMSDNIRFAVARELSNTYTERQPPASKEDMEKFVGTEHGRMLVADWGSEAGRRVATALHRWDRMTVYLTDDEADSLHNHFWRMTAKERASIVQHLGA